MRLFILLLISITSSSCQISKDTDSIASSNFTDASRLTSLIDLGDKGGQLLLAVVDPKKFPIGEQIPRVDAPEEKAGGQTIEKTLGDFVRTSGSGRRINPAVEFGAIYYIPARHYNQETGIIIRKACGTVEGHEVDTYPLIDDFSGIRKHRRKLLLNGKANFELIKFLAGINAKAEASYLIEFEVSDVRKRYIYLPDARDIRQKILGGNDCKNDYIKDIDDDRLFQLVSAYYGNLVIKQVYEISGGISVPKISVELSVSGEGEDNSLIFLKVYTDKI
ncbi:hypothetical protein [Roseibium marinum]|uniref:Uncharacterized protein n=1 Tax=Roseibium marinum TaxID=281252 RepID=A0A2S3V451_9HYPH|nr:hypothetical protein [Roseibium marinum]POF34553.1 hypothetical protein CLV41_1011009 [Roseibium marinum]